MTWPANSKHTSIRSCRIWKSRSPGVETARWTVPASSRNGCSSAGRGPENSRSHAPEPMPATQASGASGTRNPTARCRPAQSASRSRTASSPPGSIISTRKIAAAVRGASTGCGSGSGSGRATAGTCDHSVTNRPSRSAASFPEAKVSPTGARGSGGAGTRLVRYESRRGRSAALLPHPPAPPERDEQDHHSQDLGADAEGQERAQRPDVVHQPAQVLAEEPGQECQRQEHGGDDGQLLHHVVQQHEHLVVDALQVEPEQLAFLEGELDVGASEL